MLRTASLTLALTLALAATAVAGPPPVLLGTAGEFAVLGGSGLTNTGTTTITGDVGSSPTPSQPGFGPCPAANCVSLTGTNHNDPSPNDAVTQQAKTDLITAYDDAFGRTGGTAITGPIGGGQTLVSGVYTSATNIFVGGDLILDAQGDPNAVFIFQAKTSTLITAAGITSGIPNTRVLLTNGAQACNVFWQVGSSATIDTFTQFIGSILALQSITVNTSATLDTGRVLARNGAVTLDTNVIKKAACATPTTPPPSGDSTAPAPTNETPVPAPQPLSITPDTLTPVAAVLLSGTSRLRGPTRPVSGRFNVVVTGRGIHSVVFFVDGRRVRLVRRGSGSSRFVLTINARNQRAGTHRVSAHVNYDLSRSTSTSIRRITYLRPRAGRPAIPFTG